MEVRNNQFPVVVQAYEPSTTQNVFIAEQVVNTQAEIDGFTTRFAGKLIKARSLSEAEAEKQRHVAKANAPAKKSNAWIFLLLLIVILVGVGLYTGWIQKTFGLSF